VILTKWIDEECYRNLTFEPDEVFDLIKQHMGFTKDLRSRMVLRPIQATFTCSLKQG
jgi:hypothetical protein